MIHKLFPLSLMFIITASCQAAANGVDDIYLEQAVKHLQKTEKTRALCAIETARRTHLGSLLLNKDVWRKDTEMSVVQKAALDHGFDGNHIRNPINVAHLSHLMDATKPWHAGSTAEWVAVKHAAAMLVTNLATADMRTFENYTLGDNFPIWLAAMGVPIVCATLATEAYCSTAAGVGVFCCGMGIPCALKMLANIQKVNRGEKFFNAIDALACNPVWQERIALAVPKPMTMDDVADITVRVYEYPPKEKQD